MCLRPRHTVISERVVVHPLTPPPPPAGQVPGIVYSNNDLSANQKETLVKVNKIVLDREIRRLGASFDNTVCLSVVCVRGSKPTPPSISSFFV